MRPFALLSVNETPDRIARCIKQGTLADISRTFSIDSHTSALSGLDGGKFAGFLKLDALIPISGFKRCIGEGYEFVYPASWLADVTLYRRRVESAELQRGLAFQQFEQQERVAQRQRAIEPAVAFGPQGSTGEDNISVISAASPGLVCVTLRT